MNLIQRPIEWGFAKFKILKMDLPDECPHCGFKISSIISGKSYLLFENYEYIGILNHKCTNAQCNKFFFTTSLMNIDSGKTEFISCYPKNKGVIFDELILDTSPKFVELYNVANELHLSNKFESAGMTYRLALEFLLKDYLIKEENLKIEDIGEKKLLYLIKDHLKNIEELFNAADVVRVLGNDKTHYIDKNNIHIDEIKSYLDIVVNYIFMKLKIKHTPVQIQNRPSS